MCNGGDDAQNPVPRERERERNSSTRSLGDNVNWPESNLYIGALSVGRRPAKRNGLH